jgi:hypothetical protein
MLFQIHLEDGPFDGQTLELAVLPSDEFRILLPDKGGPRCTALYRRGRGQTSVPTYVFSQLVDAASFSRR